jgi:hypothetical protein
LGVGLFVILIILDKKKRELNLYAAKPEYINSVIKSSGKARRFMIGNLSNENETEKLTFRTIKTYENEEIE